MVYKASGCSQSQLHKNHKFVLGLFTTHSDTELAKAYIIFINYCYIEMFLYVISLRIKYSQRLLGHVKVLNLTSCVNTDSSMYNTYYCIIRYCTLQCGKYSIIFLNGHYR